MHTTSVINITICLDCCGSPDEQGLFGASSSLSVSSQPCPNTA